SNTQCPVLLTPEKYNDIKKIVFLFDGESNSVYALKMFNYLFPTLRNLSIEVLVVKPVESDGHLPENRLVKELIRRHYENVTYTVLKGIPEVEIINHLQKEKFNFVSVLGAYRRTMLSKWFKSSMADALVKNFDMPVFIAHNK
ncbi:MAG: universal stress protein, partial [Pseudomonadota bacterium]